MKLSEITSEQPKRMKLSEVTKVDRSQFQTPEYQGGANAPANIKAQEDVAKAQQATDMLDVPIAPMAAMNQYAGNIPRMLAGGKFPEATTPHGRSISDLGGLAGGIVSPVYPLALKMLGKLASPVTKPIGKYISESKIVKKGLEPLEALFTKPEGLPKSELVRKIEETGKDAVGKLREQKKALDKSMFQESDKAATEIQEALPKYFKNNSTTYGKELDRISDDLVKNNNQITRGELSSIYDDVIRESQEDLLASGKPMQELNYLNKKYSLSPVESEAGLLNESGSILKTPPNPNEPINFKEVVEDVKNIRKSLSSKLKAGERYSPEDVVAAKFAKRWGDYIETKVPEFRGLNEEYAPVIQTMKVAGKYFKPYSQGVDKLQGVSFLRNMAEDKLQSSEKKLLDMLEQGTPNFPGIGKKTSSLENIKNLQGKVSKDIDNIIKEYATHKRNAQDLLAKEKALKDQRNTVLAVLTGTGLLTGVGSTVAKKVTGWN